MARTITFLFYLDALRHDYITKTSMPFVDELSKKGFFGKVKTSPGFTQEAALMTGKYPEETDYFTWYRYAPDSSPFSWVRPLKPLKYLRKSRLYFPIKVGIRRITKLMTGEKYPDPSFVPLDILPNFDFISADLPRNFPTLSALCNKSGLSCFEQPLIYEFIGSARCSTIFENVIKTICDDEVFDIYPVHIGELDGLGHKYGPHPDHFRAYLLEIDMWIKRIFELVKEKGFPCNIIITSDHGMTDVIGTIDVESVLKKMPLKVPQDCLYFLDSTMARFWFFNDKAESMVRESLSSVSNGHILSQEEKVKLHMNFKNKENGELFFWLDKGYLIFPNFFQSFGPERTKGMHGYMNDADGALVIYSDESVINKEFLEPVIPIVEIFEIVWRLVGL